MLGEHAGGNLLVALKLSQQDVSFLFVDIILLAALKQQVVRLLERHVKVNQVCYEVRQLVEDHVLVAVMHLLSLFLFRLHDALQPLAAFRKERLRVGFFPALFVDRLFTFLSFHRVLDFDLDNELNYFFPVSRVTPYAVVVE